MLEEVLEGVEDLQTRIHLEVVDDHPAHLPPLQDAVLQLSDSRLLELQLEFHRLGRLVDGLLDMYGEM